MKNINRKEAMKQMGLAALGMSLFQLISCKEEFKDNHTKSTTNLAPFYIPPSSPLEPGIVGMNVRTIIRSAQTNHQFSCVEMAIAPKHMGPPPHFHQDLDEIMFVLEGEATLMVDGNIEVVQAGGWHLRPRKLEHTYRNSTDQTLRLIDMYFNQNLEDFLEKLYNDIFPNMIQNKLTPNDPSIQQQLMELDKKFGITTFPEKRQPLADKYGLIS